MKNWIRTILVCFVLIGGTISFGYWSTNQFNQAFDNLSAPSVANTLTAFSSFKKDTNFLASTSPEISRGFATSTGETIQISISTTTTVTTKSKIATSTDLGFSFTFPKKGDKVYVGCTYKLSWQSSTVINSLETVLVDAGTKEPMGPITSGLARETMIVKDLQNLSWKVGNVWSGAYYIKVSKINGIEAELRSKVFEINKIPKGLNEKEKNSICREFNG